MQMKLINDLFLSSALYDKRTPAKRKERVKPRRVSFQTEFRFVCVFLNILRAQIVVFLLIYRSLAKNAEDAIVKNNRWKPTEQRNSAQLLLAEEQNVSLQFTESSPKHEISF